MLKFYVRRSSLPWNYSRDLCFFFQDDDDGGSEAQPLVLANVGGVFIVLLAGSAMAVVCAFFEMVFDVWMVSRKMKVGIVIP